ncbi:MAG TPA: hypothetical protein VIB48_25155 [Acidimicrobiia bacterium]
MALRARRLASVVAAVVAVLAAALAGCAAPWSNTGAGPRRDAPRPAPALAVRVAAPVSTPTRTAILYGDSLSFEIRQQVVFDAALGGIHLEVSAFGGLALCDRLPDMRADLARLHPQVVVLEFAGNSFTPCMRDRTGALLKIGTPAYHDRWRADLATAIRLANAAGARLVWASAPVTGTAAGAANVRWLQAMAGSVVAGNPGAQVAPAGDAVLDRGAFSPRLPCLPDEGPAQGCTGGRIVVRAPDGTHFCPIDPRAIRGVVGDCPVYSSGARRFAAAVAGVLPVRRAAS